MPREGPARYVVFDTRTPLCEGPRLDHASCVARPKADYWYINYAAARLIEDRGKWLQIETLDAWDLIDHCASDANLMLSQRGLRLRFFIQRSALRKVTVAQTLRYHDGSSIRLRSGAPLKLTNPPSEVKPG